jgi:hypothetical protein
MLTNTLTAMNELMNEQLDNIITALDSYARDYNGYEYGLPTHDEERMEEMRNEIRRVLI